jgi:5-methylcytosine-specific restriction endonuclease McrA
MIPQMWCSTKSVGQFLQDRHYLGPVVRGFAWSDEFGVLVLAKPTARMLPQDDTWLELVRWCLTGESNAGSVPCFVCGRHVKRPHATLEHIVPLSKGGTDAMDNLTISHNQCNWRRGNAQVPD